MNIKQEILQHTGIFTKSNGINPSLTRQNSKFLTTDIYNRIMHYPIGSTLPEKIYCIVNDINKPKHCKSCDSPVTFKNYKIGYRPYCSQSCKAKSSEFQSLKKQTTLERYGVGSYSQTPEFKEKCIQTSQDRYSVNNYATTLESQVKSADTKLRKYGNAHYVNSEKTKQTCLSRYGVENGSQLHIPPQALEKLNNEDWLLNEYCILENSADAIAVQLNIQSSLVKKHLRKFKISNKFNARSDYERVLVEYISKKYKLKMDIGNRSLIAPYEVDIYLKDLNIAIEFNGRHWHKPQKYSGTNGWYEYHTMKINRCKEAGVKLLHLWEDYGDHSTLIDNAIMGTIENNLNTVLREVNWTK